MVTVLIIDDDEKVRGTLRDILEDLGCSVSEAQDGLAATSMISESSPELVFTDIFMPNQDGIETIRKIRRINASIRIVAMSGGSGFNGMDFLGMAQSLGADYILQKPIRIEQIEDIVNSFA